MWVQALLTIFGPLLARLGHILIDKYLEHKCDDEECKVKFKEYSDKIEQKKIYKVKRRK